MNFIYPQFLFGLLALSIPIIIHLFNFRRAKKVYFSNNRLLKNIKKISSSKLRLKHLLILAARLLFLFFLVLTFAQPIIPAKEGGLATGSVYIYADNSLSMSNEVNADLRAIDLALEYVNNLSDLYPRGTQIKLLTNDFAPYSNNLKNADQIKELITEISVSGISRNLQEVQDRLFADSYLNSDKTRDVYWISDFQKSTLGDIGEIEFDTTDRNYLIPLQFEQTSNVMVDSLYLENPFLMVNEANQVIVTLRNTGEERIDDLIVKLFINEIQSATASTTIEANGTNEINFLINAGLEEINRCRISFEEFPVTFDNDFYFTLNLSDRISVLEILGEGSPYSVENVYANQKLFNFSSFNISNLDYNLINNADLVIVNGLQTLDASLVSYLQEYLNNAGNIFLVPSSQPDLNSYQTLLSMASVEIDQNPAKIELNSPDLENPFFENIFENTESNFDMPSADPLLNWTGSFSNLLQLKNGQKFLSSFGTQNQIYLAASPFEDTYTDFHLHAVFVPVMYRMAALSKDLNQNFYHNINDQVIVIKYDSLSRNEIYTLRQADQEIIPSQRVDGNSLVLELPRYTLKSGFYELAKEDQVIHVLAFNQDKKESVLDQYDRESLNIAFAGSPAVDVFDVNTADSFEREIREKHFGVSLWKYALLLALFFLLVEVLLIRFLK